MADAEIIHASCVLVGEDAVLVRGAPGAGKSSLCLAVVSEARAAGRFARLVSDDRVRIEPRGGRLIARAAHAIAGLVETRGIGVYSVPHEPAACIRLVVDLVEGQPARMPEPAEATTTLGGISLPRFQIPQGRPLADAVLARLRLIRGQDHDTLVTL